MELIRSVVFVPGNRPNMLERALNFAADVIMVDLEDSVPLAEKVNARELAREWVPKLRRQGRRVMVRVNSLDTGLTYDDLAAVIGPDLSGISIGKAESVWHLRDADQIITALESAAGLEAGHVKLIPWIENARAIMSAREMAGASPRIVALAFGAEDYTDDMGVQRTDTGEEVWFARSLVAVAARAANVGSLDSPFVQFRDAEALRRDAQVARQMGFTGKFAIHPDQIDIINQAFSPSPEEVEYARQVVAAWDKAEAEGRGSVALEGRMIDVPVVKRAQNLLAHAEAIQARNV
ncbi:MAG: CoA ester lyase [Chloroflexi bacterium]|nr:CoA ester lyase [Chloroflexota bacterium]